VCGDGQQDPGEACDDANDVENDGCLATCEFGPGAVIEQKPLPPLVMLENLRCFTAIDQEQLPGDGHALVFGSIVGQAGPEGQVATRVQQLRLPELAAAEWSYFEWAGINGRVVNRMVTAANGDVIVAGMIYTEDVKVDTGGYLWLARFTPGGQVVWSEEYEEHELSPVDIELAPDGDIVLVGSFTGFGFYTAALRFHDDGQLVWEREEPPQEDFYVFYSGLTLDDDGNIYVAASRRSWGNQETSVMLQALTGDGALVWTKLHAPPDTVSVYPGDLVWTPDDRLVAGVDRRALDTYQLLDQFSLAAFDTTGAELWWQTWGVEAGSGLSVGRLIANNDGGVHALARQISAGDQKIIASLATRFDATGALVWSQLTPGANSLDALHGPDGLLYVLSTDAVLVHLP
jgi:cysteine-rich repeat protein